MGRHLYNYALAGTGETVKDHQQGHPQAAPDTQVIPTPLHVLGRISPISPPFFPVFCAFSPSRRGGSNEPQAGAQGQETVARAPEHRFGGPANSAGVRNACQDLGGMSFGPRCDPRNTTI